MVTGRQVARGVVRSMRAMDRAAKQAERRRVTHQQSMHRQAMFDLSANAAAEYEAVIEALTGAHRIALSQRDWLTIATAPRVSAPDRGNDAERLAAANLANYTPSWLTRFLKRETRDREALAEAINVAKAQDDAEHDRRIKAAEDQNRLITEAQSVVERNPNAMVRALEEHSALGSLPYSVEGLDVRFRDGRIIAIVDGLDIEDMPEESITLLKSGKASVKALPIGKRLEIHRDAVCSAAVRVAAEFLAVLPIDEIEVVMLSDILDRSSGHIDALPVLYLRVTRQAINILNLERADASALVDRLGAHLAWNKRDGLRPINAAAFGVELGE